MIRSTYDPVNRTAEMDVLRPVIEADLLVLDDLGAEKTSEWVEETLNLIVNARYSEQRTTMFTSNYDDNPDTTDPDSLLFRIGFRMRSRLHEMCEFVVPRRRRLPRAAAERRRRRPDHAVEDCAARRRARPSLPVAGPRGQARAQIRERRAGRRQGGSASGQAEAERRIAVD